MCQDSPRHNDFDVRFEAVECEFKLNLVVTLASAPVRHKTGMRDLSSEIRNERDLYVLAFQQRQSSYMQQQDGQKKYLEDRHSARHLAN